MIVFADVVITLHDLFAVLTVVFGNEDERPFNGRSDCLLSEIVLADFGKVIDIVAFALVFPFAAP